MSDNTRELLPEKSRGNIETPIGKDELLVYQPAGTRVHNLNATAATIYRACDGQTSVASLAAKLGPQGRELVDFTLAELARLGLVNWQPERRQSRREFLTRWGAAAAVLPVIVSTTLPQPAAAASGCGTQFGDTGCSNDGNPILNAMDQPTGCTTCCNPVGSTCTTCPGDCANCSCMMLYTCRNGVGSAVACSSTPGAASICAAGTNDTATGTRRCFPDVGTSQRRNCDDARTAAEALGGVLFYSCCEC